MLGSETSILKHTPDALLEGTPNRFLEVLRSAAETAMHDNAIRAIFDALPAAIYTTDVSGHITYFNDAAAALWGHHPELGSLWCGSWKLFWPDGRPMRHDECPMAIALTEDRPIRGVEALAERPDGTRVPFMPYPTPLHDASGAVVGAVNMLVDLSERKATEGKLRRQALRLEVLNRIGVAISANLELDQVVQTVIDNATDVCGAKYGAFFYNAADSRGEHYILSGLSGAPRSAFANFEPPRNTPLFEATFRGTGIVRCDDVRTDPRYGMSARHRGMPEGHLPIVSYLAVPVISRTGAVHGGLFFGHDRPGVFTAESEEIVAEIARQAAVAIDNGRLLQAARDELEQRRQAQLTAERLAAIVESSDDAILTKDLNGVVTSWNGGAERIFGYTAEEMVGRPITTIIPADRRGEETEILTRLRRGERIDHYETIRQRKDGSLVDISLTVSPLKDSDGRIIGASKIARDVTEFRRSQQQQQLLLREMDHRIKNLFALASSIVSLSARSARTPEDLVREVSERLGALARAHALTLAKPSENAISVELPTALHALLRTIVLPYDDRVGHSDARVVLHGPDIMIVPAAMTGLALLLHEFATNAAKYGALSVEDGRIDVTCSQEEGRFVIVWEEQGAPCVAAPAASEGFGSLLVRATVKGQLNGEMSRVSTPHGVRIRLAIPRERLTGSESSAIAEGAQVDYAA